ncbi:hypothetical protein ABIA32_005043 [Streptacidiphilus sp. MAP12-20]
MEFPPLGWAVGRFVRIWGTEGVPTAGPARSQAAPGNRTHNRNEAVELRILTEAHQGW